ncbi:MAG: hypothetical protein EP330_13365 [Deltaproteobacteria bacterium]|nr:MAG: hypothetical protein EP330_13365 [Deltaproteobacteria bacterium]
MDFLRRYGLPIGLVTVGVMLATTSPFGVLLAFGVGAFLLYQLREKPAALCDSCRFNDPRHCMRPERPNARVCAGYDKGAPPRPPRGQVIPFAPPPGEA